MVVSTTISTSPTLIYFGQELGETGATNAGFGKPGRTSIFDYVGVPAWQRWMNDGKFDGGKLSKEESTLRDFYQRLLNFTISSPALMGNYKDLQLYNREKSPNYSAKLFSYARWSDKQKLIITCNFDTGKISDLDLLIPEEMIKIWKLKDGNYPLLDYLNLTNVNHMVVQNGAGKIRIALKPLESCIFEVKK